MTFTLYIGLDNAAFDAGNGEEHASALEVARILRGVVVAMDEHHVLHQGESGDLRDVNGNVVGRWDVQG